MTFVKRSACTVSLCVLSGCLGAGVELTPESGSAGGYFDVEDSLTRTEFTAGQVQGVTVGGVRAYDVEAIDADTVRFVVQGAPESGLADVVFETRKADHRFEEAFTYEEPAISGVGRMAALGASLTMGVQSGVPSYHGGLMNPAAQLSHQIGAYMPLPLLVPGLFPSISATDVGPAPDCATPNVMSFVTAAITDVMAFLIDPITGEFSFLNARVDPDVEPHNLAVGGYSVQQVLDGPGDDFAYVFLTNLTLSPYAGLADAIEASQMDRLETLDVDIIVSPDLIGNDVIGSVMSGESLRPESVTDPEDLEPLLIELFDRLSATGAESFLANAPDPTALPATAQSAANMLESGEVTEAELEVIFEEILAKVKTINAMVDSLAAQYDNVHIVDFYGGIGLVADEGLQIGDETLEVGRFTGLLSLDQLHFSDTGYATLANFMLESINEVFGADAEGIDLEAVLAQDPYSRANLEAAGLDWAACDP
jgi:hypothetical protein